MPVHRKDNIDDWRRKEKYAIASALLQSAELIAVSIQEETPVQTGNLKSSIQPTGRIEDAGGGRWKTNVNTPVDYAPWVEYGTRKMEPRAMFRKGIAKSQTAVRKLFESILKSIV